jgi:hypothetical protein
VFTLWRHYAARFLSAFAAAFAILALLLVAVDAVLHLASLADETDSLAAAVLLLLERSAAAYAEYLLSLSAFVAAFWSAGNATLQRETLAMKAGGISPLVAFAPLLVLGLALSVLHFGAMETLGVRAAAALAARKNPSGGDVRVRAGGVWYHAGRVVYSAREVDRDGVVRTTFACTSATPPGSSCAPSRRRARSGSRRSAGSSSTRACESSTRRRQSRHRASAAKRASCSSSRATAAHSCGATSSRASRSRRCADAAASRAALTPATRASCCTPSQRPCRGLSWLALLAIPLAPRSEGRRSLARAALQGAAPFFSPARHGPRASQRAP